MTYAQRTSIFAANRKPLVQATAAACLTLAAGYSFASVVCTSSVTTPVSNQVYACNSFSVTGNGSIEVSSSPAVSVQSSNEFPTVIDNYKSVISNSTNAIEVEIGANQTTVNNHSGALILGKEYAVTRLGSTAITIVNDGQMVGSIMAKDLTNNGTVTLKTNVDKNDIRNSGDIGSAYLTGSFIQSSQGTLRVAFSSGGESLNVAGASLAGTLDVDVHTVNAVHAGDQLDIIRTTGAAISGQFNAITDNSALFNFTQGKTGVSNSILYIEAVRALTVEQAARDNSNFPGVGAAQVFDSGASGLQNVIDKLNQLGTEKEVSDAVTQTLPLNNGAPAAATMDALSSVNQIVQARIEGSSGLSTGDATLSDRYVWVKPFGSWADQKDRDGVSGYDARTYGMTLGADGALSSKVRLGAAVAYANIDINGNSSVAPQSSTVDVYQLIGYGSYSLDSQSNVNFQLDVGQSRNQGERQIPLMGVTASSDYDSLTAHAGVGLGHNYTLSDSSSFTAAVRADYSWLKDKGYGETGAGALDLQVQGRSTEALVLGVDGKFNKNYDSGTQLQASLGVGYDTMNRQASIVSAFAGAPTANFVTYGAKPSPWQVRGGLGITRKLASGLEITGRYDALYKTDFLNQTLSVKLRWLF